MNRPPPNGPRPPEDATDPTLSAIVEPGRALTHGLAGYYSVLHQAAQAEDLAALKAESDESAEAISGILSIAAQGSPLGSAAQTVAQSTIRLVAEIENARLTAARYDDILAALEAVDARDLELVEDVAGLTVLATLAGTLEAMAVNDLPFAIRRFNLIDPRDSAASEQALRDALAVAEDLRVVADTDVLGAVAEIAESHVELTKKVREREGETAATLRRIRDIGNDAADVADAVTGFIDGGDE